MTAPNHVTAGRTASRVLLVAVVLAAAIAGTVGTAAAEPMDGKGDDPFPPALYSLDGKGNDVYLPPLYSLDGKGNDVYPPPLYSLDGKGNDVYPPPGVYASRETAEVVGSTTNGVVADDFLATYVGRGGGSGKPSF
jgi:hypothetical protein